MTHVGLVTKDFERMFDYYTDIIGLPAIAGDRRAAYAVLRGTAGESDVTLLRQRGDLEPGLHHVGLQVADEADLVQALPKLAARGIAVERDIDHPARRAVTIRDLSGIGLQFFVNRNWKPETIATISADDAPYAL